MKKSDWQDLLNFNQDEFTCKGPEQGTCSCGGVEDMDPDFMARLQKLRTMYGKPMTITSGYRCPDHNNAISSTGRNGPHTKGKCADIAVARGEAWKILDLATRLKFNAIGVQQKGDGRFLHIEDRDTPTVWSY